MIDDVLNAEALPVLEQLARFAGARHRLIAHNIANLDTPGYRALRASFPERLGQARKLEMSRTDGQHMAPPAGSGAARGTIEQAPATRVRLDGNTVDVDREMTALAAVQARYNAAAQMVRKRFALLRYAVTDGKG